MTPPRRKRSVLLAAAIALAGAATPVTAQLVAMAENASAAGQRQDRIISTIDFEERSGGNVETLPMGWVKLQAPGMPHYVEGRLARDAARSGEYSFRLTLNGGSVAYRHVLPERHFAPGTHYRVQVYARTTPLDHARCRLTAYFVDAAGKPVLETLTLSEPFAHRPGDTGEDLDWRRLAVELPAVDERCRRLIVELALLQPELLGSARPQRRQLFEQDITGQAWFDDVTVAQVPRMHIETPVAGNVFGLSDPLALTVVTSDEYMDDLSVSLRVFDAEAEVVHQQTVSVPGSAEAMRADVIRRSTIQLPPLEPGWYRVQVMLHNGQIELGVKTLDFVRLADDAPALLPDGRFALSATHLPLETWDDLLAVLPRLGAGRVKLALWTRSADLERDAAARLDAALQRLKQLNIAPTACLLAPPPHLRRHAGDAAWGGLPNMPREAWQSALSLLVSRHAHHVPAWQLGGDDDAVRFVTDPNYRQAFDAVREQFAQLVQQPDLAMPWPVWFEPLAKMPPSLTLLVPPEVLPEHIPLYINEVRQNHVEQVAVSLSPIDLYAYGREKRIADFACRIAYSLAGGANRLDLPLPFAAAPDGTRDADDSSGLARPQEMLLIERTLMMALGGSTYRGRVTLGQDVEALLFEKGGTGVVLFWATRPEHAAAVDVNLGGEPYLLDLWGRRHGLSPGRTAGAATDAATASTVQVPLNQIPAMLVGIDPDRARLRSSVHFENPRLESDFAAHERVLTFTNTFTAPISGEVRLAGPEGWRVQLEPAHFALQPGERYRGVARLQFPYNSVAGQKVLTASLNVRSDSWQQIEAPVALELGLSQVGLQTLAARDGQALIVQQVITNYAAEPLDYSAFVHVPGQARQERLVSQLEPGKATIKRYRFESVSHEPGMTVRSGIKELEGTRILNEDVVVE